VGEKKKFLLRIDEETMKALEKWAADEFRSLNGQIEYLLDEAIRRKKRQRSANNDSDDNKDLPG
jgi:hypothetical protein